MTEDVRFMSAMWADEYAHVLDNAEHGNLRFLEHRDALARIDQRDVLRCGHDDRAFEGNTLRDGELRVAGSRWHIDHKNVQRRPGDVVHHLGERRLHHRPAPDHRRVFGDEKSDGHRLDAELLDGLKLVAVAFRFVGDVEQARHGGAVDVGVEQPDFQAQLCQSQRQIDRDGGFADAALAAGDRDHARHAFNAGGLGPMLLRRRRGTVRVRMLGMRLLGVRIAIDRAGVRRLAMRGEHGGDGQNTRQRVDGIFRGLAQRFGCAAVFRRHFDGEADMPVAHDKALYQSGVHDVLAACRIGDAGERVQNIVPCCGHIVLNAVLARARLRGPASLHHREVAHINAGAAKTNRDRSNPVPRTQ